MTEPAPIAGPAATSWRLANIALVVVALVLVAACSVFLEDGASAAPGGPRAESLSKDYRVVTKAAREQTLAFLTVDHRDMDPLIAKVLAGATGAFKQQYEKAEVNLKASAQDSRAISTGKVISVGVGDIGDNDAVVLVAADSQVSNKSTKGKAQPRYYRLRLTMVRKGETWLTSNLDFVG